MTLAKTDLAVARRVRHAAGPGRAAALFDLVVDEHDRTVERGAAASRAATSCSATQPALARTLRTRDTYLLPLQLLQVALLRPGARRPRGRPTGRPAAAPGAAAHRQRHRDRPAQHRLSQRPRRPTNYGF